MAIIVNLFGGPCAGKSTVRAGVFYELKVRGYSCEEASEWIKAKVYEGSPYIPTDQIYIFAKQRKLLRQIGDKVDIVISDSPLLLSLIYDGNKDDSLRNLVVNEFNKDCNVNFLLQRGHGYDHTGRYQSEQEADAVHEKIKETLEELRIPYVTISSTEAKDFIVKTIESKVAVVPRNIVTQQPWLEEALQKTTVSKEVLV